MGPSSGFAIRRRTQMRPGLPPPPEPHSADPTDFCSSRYIDDNRRI